MIEESNGAFRCAVSITGVAIEQFEQYVPEMIDLLEAPCRYREGRVPG